MRTRNDVVEGPGTSEAVVVFQIRWTQQERINNDCIVLTRNASAEYLDAPTPVTLLLRWRSDREFSVAYGSVRQLVRYSAA